MQAHGPGGTPGKTILVVEDDPVNGLVLLDFLEAHGYRVFLSKTGPDGVLAFDKDQPDMVLVDVLLPRKNGFEVCFDIKRTERGRTVPVVLMSAIYKDVVHAHWYAKTDLGAAGFLVKPFDLADLLARVHALIGPSAAA
ncbi:MAG TPA: response regulator [Polyangiaceae bacterium]|jgi:DNA-binding response OmpR family regulator